MLKSIFSFFILILFSHQLFAGAWVREKGHGYAQLSYTHIKANELFDKDNADLIVLNRFVSDNTLGAYFEYGLFDKLTVEGFIPLKMVGTDDEIISPSSISDTLPPGKLTGLGNTSLALKYNLVNKKYIISLRLKTEAPGFGNVSASGLQTGFNTWTFHPAILLARGWDKYYFTSEAGVRLRGNGYSNEFYGNIEGGYNFNKLWLIALVEVKQSFFDGTRNDGSYLNTTLFVNNQQYVSPGIKLIYKASKHLHVNAGVYGAFSGNLVMAYPSLNIGLAYEW